MEKQAAEEAALSAHHHGKGSHTAKSAQGGSTGIDSGGKPAAGKGNKRKGSVLGSGANKKLKPMPPPDMHYALWDFDSWANAIEDDDEEKEPPPPHVASSILPWGSMDDEERQFELLLASLDPRVQILADADGIDMPAPMIERPTMGGDVPKWDAFEEWWVYDYGGDDDDGPARKEFLELELATAMEDEGILEEYDAEVQGREAEDGPDWRKAEADALLGVRISRRGSISASTREVRVATHTGVKVETQNAGGLVGKARLIEAVSRAIGVVVPGESLRHRAFRLWYCRQGILWGTSKEDWKASLPEGDHTAAELEVLNQQMIPVESREHRVDFLAEKVKYMVRRHRFFMLAGRASLPADVSVGVVAGRPGGPPYTGCLEIALPPPMLDAPLPTVPRIHLYSWHMDAYTLEEMQAWFSPDECCEDEPLFAEAERVEEERKETERRERARRIRERQRLREDRQMVALADQEAALARLLEEDDDNEVVQLNDLEKDGPISGWVFGGPPSDELTNTVRVDFVKGIGYVDGSGLVNGDEEIEVQERADEISRKLAEEAAVVTAKKEEVRRKEEEIQRRKDAEQAARMRDEERDEEVAKIEAMLSELKERRKGEAAEAAKKKAEDAALAARAKEEAAERKQQEKEAKRTWEERKKQEEKEAIMEAARAEAMRQRLERTEMARQDAESQAYAIAAVLAEEERLQKLAFLEDIYSPFVGYFDDDGNERERGCGCGSPLGGGGMSHFTMTSAGGFAFGDAGDSNSNSNSNNNNNNNSSSTQDDDDDDVEGLVAQQRQRQTQHQIRMSQSAPLVGLANLGGGGGGLTYTRPLASYEDQLKHQAELAGGGSKRRHARDRYALPFSQALLDGPEYPATEKYACSSSVTDSMVQRMIDPSASGRGKVNSRGRAYEPAKGKASTTTTTSSSSSSVSTGRAGSAVGVVRASGKSKIRQNQRPGTVVSGTRGVSGIGRGIDDLPLSLTKLQHRSRPSTHNGSSSSSSRRGDGGGDSRSGRKGGAHGLVSSRPSSREEAVADSLSVLARDRGVPAVPGAVAPKLMMGSDDYQYGDQSVGSGVAGMRSFDSKPSAATSTAGGQSAAALALHSQHTHTFTKPRTRQQYEEYRPGFHQVRREEALMVAQYQRQASGEEVELDQHGLPLLEIPADQDGADSGMHVNSIDSQDQRRAQVYIGGGQTGLNPVPLLGVKGKPSKLHTSELQQLLSKMK
jgi:hypothetical protein